MLVPGEYLTCPVPPEQMRAPIPPGLEGERLPEQRITEAVTATPITAIEDPEPRSFLLILLRAFGAVHT